MKTKREKNSIIASFAFSTIIFVGLIFIFSSYVYENISTIEAKKTEFKTLFDDYKKIQKSGLSLEQIKASTLESHTNANITAFLSGKANADMIKKVSQSFFKSEFSNSGSRDYISFLDDKLKKLEKSDLRDDFIKTQEKIFTVLPIYTDKQGLSTKSITNFTFVSYVENILRKFSLKTNSAIGISNLVPVEDKQTEKKRSIEESIFYIPLKLQLVGSKSSIIDFLEYIQESGAVSYTNGELDIKNRNHLSDIESITMQNYIDSSTIIEDTSNIEELKDVIKSSQAQEKFEISVNLRFYVIGVPAYKVKIEAEKVIGKNSKESFNYFVLKTKTAKLLAKAASLGEGNYRVKQLKNINSYLTEITKDINSLTISLNKNTELDKVFEASQKYKNIFEAIDVNLLEIEKSLK